MGRFKFALMCRYPDKLSRIKSYKPEWIFNFRVRVTLIKNATEHARRALTYQFWIT